MHVRVDGLDGIVDCVDLARRRQLPTGRGIAGRLCGVPSPKVRAGRLQLVLDSLVS